MKLLIIALLVTLAIGCGKAPDNTTNAVRLVTVSAYCIDANLSNPSSTATSINSGIILVLCAYYSNTLTINYVI
jgi:hypothetical protein